LSFTCCPCVTLRLYLYLYVSSILGIHATHARHLIIAWLQALRNNRIHDPIDILLFSTPKSSFNQYLTSAQLTNYQIQDYFNVNVDDDKELDVHQRLTTFVAQRSHSILVIDCLGTLALQIGPAKACRFIEKLSRDHKSSVFCIYRRDFFQTIPRIESLGSIHVTLNKSKKASFGCNIYYEISVTQKKSHNVAHWSELIEQNIENYVLRSEKLTDSSDLKIDINKFRNTAKPQASFRLEMSEKEIKQRDSVPLPYILSGNPERESRIFYLPDDYDDEDPDDDLDV
jgi:nucleoside-triphosphatase THEP1